MYPHFEANLAAFDVMTSTQAMPYFDRYLRDKVTIMGRIVWHYDSSGVQARVYFRIIVRADPFLRERC